MTHFKIVKVEHYSHNKYACLYMLHQTHLWHTERNIEQKLVPNFYFVGNLPYRYKYILSSIFKISKEVMGE